MDSGLNADITYSIISGDDLQQFSINSHTGFISVAALLDREAVSFTRSAITVALTCGAYSVTAMATLIIRML